jgi:hypothetical protein
MVRSGIKHKSIMCGVVSMVDNSDDEDYIEPKIDYTTDKDNEDQDEVTLKFLTMCDKFEDKLKTEYRSNRDQVRSIKKMYLQDIKIAKKTKKKKLTANTGFAKPTIVPDCLTTFLGLATGIIMTRPQLTKLLYKEFEDRDLHDKKDKRLIRADKEIMKMFNLNDSVNKITNPKDTKNGLNIYNIQTYISECYNNQPSKPSSPLNASTSDKNIPKKDLKIRTNN